MQKVAVVMGSKSDFDVAAPCIKTLKKFGVLPVVRVLSAHRTPDEAIEFAQNAESEGIGAIVAVAGKAAHLGGVLAANTVRPVIALPVKTSFLDGLDSVLSILPMPSGIPVAVVGVNAGENAGLLAVKMLAIGDKTLAEKLKAYSKEMHDGVIKADGDIQAEVDKL